MFIIEKSQNADEFWNIQNFSHEDKSVLTTRPFSVIYLSRYLFLLEKVGGAEREIWREIETCFLFFFLIFIYLFIYLFLAMLGLCFCARAFSSCGEQGPLFIAVRRPLTIAASCCGAQAPDAQAQ